MRKATIFLVALLATLLPVRAQREAYRAVIANPAEDTRRAMNISWSTDTAWTDTYVLYAKATDTGWTSARKAKPLQNELCLTYDSLYSKTAEGDNFYQDVKLRKCGATLTGLQPDTRYKYRIASASHPEAVSGTHYFKTSGADAWKACVISDFHTYSPLPKRLKSAMGVLDMVRTHRGDIDWVLGLGDVVAWGGSYAFWEELCAADNVKNYFWANTNGNHDNMDRTNTKLSSNYMRDANYYPRNAYSRREMGCSYFFWYGDALFFCLNSMTIADDTELHEAQRWMRDVVGKNKGKFRYLVVFEHYPWFSGSTGSAIQYSRWNDVFDELGVDLALGGDHHIYVRSAPVKAGAMTDGTTGTVYVQTPSCDNDRGAAMNDNLTYNEDLIVKRWTEGDHTVGAILLEANPERLSLTLIDRDGGELDTFTVPAKNGRR